MIRGADAKRNIGGSKYQGLGIELNGNGIDTENNRGVEGFPSSSSGGNISFVHSRDARVTMETFSAFMRILMAISAVCIILSWFIPSSWTASFTLTAVLMVCIASFMFCEYLVDWILLKDAGTDKMRSISDAIKEGSEGFLYTQYSAISIIAVVVSTLLFVLYLFRASSSGQFVGNFTMASVTALSFLFGAACSGIAGFIGVWISVRVNIRVASAASRYSFQDALQLSFRGGAVSSILSASCCIVGVVGLYLFVFIFVRLFSRSDQIVSSHSIPRLISGYGFGASFVALFMQLGGGIYTKAADVGADMVGKIEKDIPEDDPRNPAVIADLVGDNVGDCAGSMADVFESIAAEIVGTMILGGSLGTESNLPYIDGYIFFPLIIHALDLIISGIGIILVRSASENEDPLVSMKRSYGVCMGVAVFSFFVTTRIMLYTDVAPVAWWYYACCGFIGIECSYLLVITTQYYTDYAYSPVRKIANASATGHGTNIISGISVGLESTALPACIIASSLLISYSLGKSSGLAGENAGLFGIACATMGMLCTAVFILSMNNFGPIADNAGGIVEMSEQPENVRRITDRLDAVGNVTKAATKGYAIGGSALACFVLFQAFIDEINEFTRFPFKTVDIAKVEVTIAGLLGISLVFLFTGWAIDAVGRTAQEVVWEVRRQFKELSGIMEGTRKPEYGRCVTIVTRAALREMIRPALLALTCPILIGLLFAKIGALTGRDMLGVEVLASFLIFGTLTGFIMAIFLDNSGGAWDNAKKYIEATSSKGSEAHKAAVTGDTVGDPFKDTAGPALHVIIMTMNTTALVLGPMFIGSAALK